MTKEISFRKKQLLRLRQLLQDNENDFNEALLKDFGKPVFETYGTELAQLIDEIDDPTVIIPDVR